MPEPLRVVLDQNVPPSVTTWLRELKPHWEVWHTSDIALAGVDDPQIFQWAQERKAVIITYDADLVDQRTYPLGSHHGVVRLR